jgi:catechol 2,3-dioxygenase-like lactoylglutathione lyase family enzyme
MLTLRSLGKLVVLAVVLPGGFACSVVAPVRHQSDAPRQNQQMFTGEMFPVLYVSDLRRSVEFYRDKLGFPFRGYGFGSKLTNEWSETEPPYAAMFGLGGQDFVLHDYKAATGEAVAFRAVGTRHHIFVTNATEYHASVESHGVKIDRFVKGSNDRVFLFSVTDPDGHALYFIQKR